MFPWCGRGQSGNAVVRKGLGGEEKIAEEASDAIDIETWFEPAGFFALRSPLLPFDDLLAWGLEQTDTFTEERRDGLQAALVAECRRALRSKLSRILARPEVREAIFIASPSLSEAIAEWCLDPESKGGCRAERALVRYVLRMASRPTPYGLFAGCSVGKHDKESRLVLAPRAANRRHSRLDTEYLRRIVDAMVSDFAMRQAIKYFPNPALYRMAGQVRYPEMQVDRGTPTYQLVSMEEDSYLTAVLECSAQGARIAELVSRVVELDPDIAIEDATQYVGELVDNQVILPMMTPPVTGREPVYDMIAQLKAAPSAAGIAAAVCLEHAQAELAAFDDEGLGVEPSRYRSLIQDLSRLLPGQADVSTLFQVDMVKPVEVVSLAPLVLAEVLGGVELLRRITPRDTTHRALESFKDAFRERYKQREVPLVEVLDEESGIGFEALGQDEGSGSLLLNGLPLTDRIEQTKTWFPHHDVLLRKLAQAIQEGATEILLSAADVLALEQPRPMRLIEGFAAIGSLAAASDEALARGDFRFVLGSVRAVSGACLLGRFCHADAELHRLVRELIKKEESHHPEAIYAEIAHLSDGRMGNVSLRPVLRSYEIQLLGRSGGRPDQRIPITDLLVSVEADRIVLRSAQHGCEVLPRLASAHNFSLPGLAAYRFLGFLQYQGTMGFAQWDWGPLNSASFLPRVSSGRLVLSLAKWNLDEADLAPLKSLHGNDIIVAVLKLRERRGLPRWIQIVDGDHQLPIDLDNFLCMEAFADWVKGRSSAEVVELFPGPSDLCVRGPEGRYANELVIPFVQKKCETAAQPAHTTRLRPDAAPHPRSFSPGSEWLYAKLYCGAATADHVMTSILNSVVTQTSASKAIDLWHFIRYADPAWHLRVRFHGKPDRLIGEVLPALHVAAAPLLTGGQLRRVCLDTYEREIERYGGREGTALSEQVFAVDSDAVLAILQALGDDIGGDVRWRIALCCMDAMLGDMGFTLIDKLDFTRSMRRGYEIEFHAGQSLEHVIAQKYRDDRQCLEAMINSRLTDEVVPSGCRDIIDERSQRLAPLGSQLRSLADAGDLRVGLSSLVADYIHLHVNRMLRSAGRRHELVLYAFLERLYASRRAVATRADGDSTGQRAKN
jgi:thiopeptide-type bacteriocin biosynthesis protein